MPIVGHSYKCKFKELSGKFFEVKTMHQDTETNFWRVVLESNSPDLEPDQRTLYLDISENAESNEAFLPLSTYFWDWFEKPQEKLAQPASSLIDSALKAVENRRHYNKGWHDGFEAAFKQFEEELKK